MFYFSKALNVTPAYLMGWEDEPNEDIEKISLAIGLIKYFIDAPEEFPDWFEIGNGIRKYMGKLQKYWDWRQYDYGLLWAFDK